MTGQSKQRRGLAESFVCSFVQTMDCTCLCRLGLLPVKAGPFATQQQIYPKQLVRKINAVDPRFIITMFQDPYMLRDGFSTASVETEDAIRKTRPDTLNTSLEAPRYVDVIRQPSMVLRSRSMKNMAGRLPGDLPSSEKDLRTDDGGKSKPIFCKSRIFVLAIMFWCLVAVIILHSIPWEDFEIRWVRKTIKDVQWLYPLSRNECKVGQECVHIFSDFCAAVACLVSCLSAVCSSLACSVFIPCLQCHKLAGCSSQWLPVAFQTLQTQITCSVPIGLPKDADTGTIQNFLKH